MISAWARTWRPNFLKKYVLAQNRSFFFLVQPKDAQRRFLQIGQGQIWKKICFWSTKKVKYYYLKFRFRSNILKIKLKTKMLARATGGSFFSGYNQIVHKRRFFNMVKVNLKSISPKCKKIEKLTFEITIWLKTANSLVLVCVLALLEILFYRYNRKICTDDFCKLFRIRF